MSDSASGTESDEVDNAANIFSPVLFGRVRKQINHNKETSLGMDKSRLNTSRCRTCLDL